MNNIKDKVLSAYGNSKDVVNQTFIYFLSDTNEIYQEVNPKFAGFLIYMEAIVGGLAVGKGLAGEADPITSYILTDFLARTSGCVLNRFNADNTEKKYIVRPGLQQTQGIAGTFFSTLEKILKKNLKDPVKG